MRTKDALRYFGGAVQLAQQLGITKQAVYKWGTKVPRGRDYQIEVLTGGKLKADCSSEVAA